MLATLRTIGFVFQMSFRRENIDDFLFRKILTAEWEVGNYEGTAMMRLSCIWMRLPLFSQPHLTSNSLADFPGHFHPPLPLLWLIPPPLGDNMST